MIMKIILASASPRRKELLKQVVKDFEIIPASGEEKANTALPPEQIVCALAESKCCEVFEKYPDSVVIGCDTIVYYKGKVLGKPKSRAEAEETLKELSGKTHSVYTGVCIRSPERRIAGYDETEVTFNELSDGFIKSYVDGGSPMDKAGCYGIQDGGVVKSYKGSYTNVVGLPLELVEKMLKEVLVV
ncbi:MAG: Maf family protein [Clostridia bacterium]|nr:Maf family protein [Clostridia bacterium]